MATYENLRQSLTSADARFMIVVRRLNKEKKMKDTPEDFTNRKEARRKNIEQKNAKYKDFFDESLIKESKIKQEIKKKKQSFEDEEWEDWDRYYNH